MTEAAKSTLKIRLARGGAKKRPYYSIVVADSHSPRDGRFIEKVGTYNPLLPKDGPTPRVTLKLESIQAWIAKGAQPTDRVARFLALEGIGQWAHGNNPTKGKPGKKSEERAAERAQREIDRAAAAAELAANPPAREPEPERSLPQHQLQVLVGAEGLVAHYDYAGDPSRLGSRSKSGSAKNNPAILVETRSARAPVAANYEHYIESVELQEADDLGEFEQVDIRFHSSFACLYALRSFGSILGVCLTSSSEKILELSSVARVQMDHLGTFEVLVAALTLSDASVEDGDLNAAARVLYAAEALCSDRREPDLLSVIHLRIGELFKVAGLGNISALYGMTSANAAIESNRPKVAARALAMIEEVNASQ